MKRTTNGRVRILALDVATVLGWAISATQKGSGVLDLSKPKDETFGIKVRRFDIWLRSMIVKHKPDCIVFERTSGRHKGSLIHQSELHGILKNVTLELELEMKPYVTQQIKKRATGRGNASKEDCVEACINKLNINPIDDNQSDALWLWVLANEEMNPE